MPGPKPNVILIMVDQMRHDAAGFAGNRVAQTPALDRLASEGPCFENAYCASPVCSPARASWLTGLYPHHHGLLGNYGPKRRGIPGYEMPPTVPTMGDAFSRAGYRCGMIGPWHMGNDEQMQHGFESLWCPYRYVPQEKDQYLRYLDRLGLTHLFRGERANAIRFPTAHGEVELPVGVTPLPTEHQRTSWTVDRGIEFIRGTDAPFFLFLSIKDPHPPIAPPAECLARYRREDIPAPLNWEGNLDGKPAFQRTFRNRRAEAFGREGFQIYTRYYLALVTHVDTQVGRFLQALDEAGRREDTVVAFISDHGEMLGDHGFLNKVLLYEGSVRVPWLLRWPGQLPAGTRVRAPVAGVDLAPTLLDLAGVPAVGAMDGRSVAAALRSGTEPPAATVFAEISALEAIGDANVPRENLGNSVMARRENWKYIWYRNGDEELYDLQADPGECLNAAGPAASADRVERMRRCIREELRPEPQGPYGWCVADR